MRRSRKTKTEPEGVPQETAASAPTPHTFDFADFVRAVAKPAPRLDLAAQALVREVVQEKGFEHVLTYRLPDGSILITKR